MRLKSVAGEIPEAQGNGSGAMHLAKMLHKHIEIKHGEGSIIFARPSEDNFLELGGRIIEGVDVRINEF